MNFLRLRTTRILLGTLTLREIFWETRNYGEL